MNAVRARHLWTGDQWLQDATVVLEDDRVVEVRPARPADGPARSGMVIPGLINAHVHLELSHLVGRVPPSARFGTWLADLVAHRTPIAPDQLAAAAQAAVDLGTAAVVDISNDGQTASAIVAAGLQGVVQHEVLGFHAPDLEERIAACSEPDRWVDGPAGGVWLRPGPHAPTSTPEALIAAAARPGNVPASIHVAEDPAELMLLADGSGPFADLLDRLGRDWRWWTPPGCSPIAMLERLGVLGPSLLLVHARHLGNGDSERIARSGAAVCLCPRSNMHIGQAVPQVGALLEAGVDLLLGTDSLASCPDLDLFGEVDLLRSLRPDVPAATWLEAITGRAARRLDLAGLGRLSPGSRPGLLHVFAEPGGRWHGAERRWLARARVEPLRE